MSALEHLTPAQREAATVERCVCTPAGNWLGLYGYLCLGLRHPATRELRTRNDVVRIVKQLGAQLVEWGVLTPAQLREAERVEIDEGGL